MKGQLQVGLLTKVCFLLFQHFILFLSVSLSSALSAQVIFYCLPDVVSLTSELDSCFGTETLETVKCGTGDGARPVSTWEEISVAL